MKRDKDDKARSRAKVFGLLKVIIFLLVAVLITINLLYIKTACSGRQCLTVNISTILLLMWVTAFWFVILKYSEKEEGNPKDKERKEK